MILLKSENGDFIYLDVVTQYSRSFNSQVTQHPVDGSGTTSDHVVKQNPRYQFVGKISGADFNFSKPRLTPESRAFIGIDQIVVESSIASEVEVSYDNNPLNLLPDVAGQFFSDTLPSIDNLNEIKESAYTEKALFEILKEFYNTKAKLSVYEFDNGDVSDPIENSFITSLNLNESVTDGDALAFDITLEQITISNLIEEEIPEDVALSLRGKAEEKANKGGQTGEEVDTSRLQDLTSFLGDLTNGN